MLFDFHIWSNSVKIRQTCWRNLFALCSSNSLQNQLPYWLAWTLDVTGVGEQTARADQLVAHECLSYGRSVCIPVHPCNISSAASPLERVCCASSQQLPRVFQSVFDVFFLEGIPLPLYWNASTQRPSPPVRFLVLTAQTKQAVWSLATESSSAEGPHQTPIFMSLCRLIPSHPEPVFA